VAKTRARPSPAMRNLGGALGAATTPARLGLLLAGLMTLALAWGVTAAVTVATRTSAAANVVSVSEPLSVDSQRIYRSLSDADATEAAAFLSGGLEPLSLRRQFLSDISGAADELAAASAAAGHSTARVLLSTLAVGLPEYAGLVETARADSRLGLPLGAAYLREASGLMRATLLPAARELYAQENTQLTAASRQATAVPYVALAVAVAVAVVLVLAQYWLTRRTHRVLNPGLLLASVAGLASVIWLASALGAARVNLDAAHAHGSAPVEALSKAGIAVLRAHADESLTLIDRSGDDSFQRDFLFQERSLGPGPGTLLTTAAAAAAGSPAQQQAAAAAHIAPSWFAVHRRVRSLDNAGSYPAAVHLAIGTAPADSGGLFHGLDSDLTTAIGADQRYFRAAAAAGQADLTGLEAGMIVLALLMAAGCGWGISRRLAEYR
jgi:hypothetical protein